VIGYACKYTPLELIRVLGGDPVLINREAESFEAADKICPGNLCSYSRSLIEAVYSQNLKELCLVNCCDSIRRCFDVLHEEGSLDFIFLMDLPHLDDECAREQLAGELRRFYREYSAYKGTGFNASVYREAFTDPEVLPDEKFIAVLGARISDEGLALFRESLPYAVLDLTCCGNRYVATPPLQSPEFDALAYAAELMAQTACMRMDRLHDRTQLLGHPKLAGVIYHTVAFCDFYAFEYERQRREIPAPVLKLESDYRTGSGGQLGVRLGAFCESMGTSAGMIERKERMGNFVAGIDSGSTTTNIAVLDTSGKICGSVTVSTGPKAALGAAKALDAALLQMGIERDEIMYVVATGYGRDNIGFADSAITEISCHAKGARFLKPEARTVIDIGGQDSKVICIDENGAVENFVMNDKCAAGTGRFLEMMARTLELDMEEMGQKGMSWIKELTISSVCTVFAESEVISLIADNHSEEDIIHGLNLAVATRTASLVHRAGGLPPFIMTGGVARNPGVVSALQKKLDTPMWIAGDPDLCGAIGAALFALEAVKL